MVAATMAIVKINRYPVLSILKSIAHIPMKTLRLHCIAAPHTTWEPILGILAKHYRIELTDQNPDYILCMIPNRNYRYCRYEGVRIFLSTENFTPDFNTVDYAIGSDHLTFQDRYFRYPVYMSWYPDSPSRDLAVHKHETVPDDIYRTKTLFCNFIYNHQGQQRRGDFFDQLNRYRRVEAPGVFRNNMPDHFRVTNPREKLAFQRRCRFTIAFEACSMRGLTTEKILDAFAAQTIPIYLGNPDIPLEFDPDSFINGHDYPSWDALIQRVMEVDQNESEYLRMLRTPAFRAEYLPERQTAELERFLTHIFDQEKTMAYRRSRCYIALAHDLRMAELRDPWGQFRRFGRKIRRFCARLIRGKKRLDTER